MKGVTYMAVSEREADVRRGHHERKHQIPTLCKVRHRQRPMPLQKPYFRHVQMRPEQEREVTEGGRRLLEPEQRRALDRG